MRMYIYSLHSSCKCTNITQHKITYFHVTSPCPPLMSDNNKESTLHINRYKIHCTEDLATLGVTNECITMAIGR